jgi:hypothetical protein
VQLLNLKAFHPVYPKKQPTLRFLSKTLPNGSVIISLSSTTERDYDHTRH